MRKMLVCVSALLLCANAVAQNSSRPDWENPEVFAVNKEQTRATSLPYPSEALAMANNYAASPYFMSLNGEWRFYWVPRVADVPAGFYDPTYDVSGWDFMPVPGNWEFNGYGIPMYINTGFGFPKNPPYIDHEDSPTGAYRHDFEIPADWDGRRVFIHFEGSTNSMYVWVNGQKVGYTQNAKSPAEFDITPYIRTGKNTLACEVHKFSDGSYLEDQDMWRLGGINRNVYLYSTADTRLLDFFAHPDLDANYKNGIFSLDVSVKNYGTQSADRTVEVTIFDKNGRKVLSQKKNATVSGGGITELALGGKVSSPLKWSAETPNLYTMVVTLRDKSGNVIESTSSKIGFRKVEIKDGQVLVNGKKVYFKGVDLHEFNTNTGQVATREMMMRNLQLMKELNVNAVRTSHYPQPPLWYELCDEYGIYLVDEANLESHGLGYGPDNVSNFPEWHGAHMDRVIRLVERDKNHPSVIFWSLGNEASNGKAFHDMYAWAKQRDASRPVQYEQSQRPNDTNTDVLCPMYPSWESMKRDAAADLGKPYIMCEYAHAMGNSMGNFQEYWDLMRSSKNMQGGFIWEWYNHGYPTTDEQGRFYWAYGGDLKSYNKMNDGNFCMDGVVTPDQQYMPHTYIVKKVYQNILFESKDPSSGMITVVNDYKFTDITPQNFSFKWVLLKNGEESASGTFTTNIAADSRKDVKIALPAIKSEPGVEYFLQVFAYTVGDSELLPAGFESAREEFAFATNNYFAKMPGVKGKVNVKKSERDVALSANGTEYVFATTDGATLRHAAKDGKRIFRNMPRLNFWRAPTDNDFGAGDQYNMRLWEVAGYNVIYRYKGMQESGEGITMKYEAKLRAIDAKVDLYYTVNPDGELTIKAHYKALSDELPEMMRFGMIMSLPKEYDTFTWYGRGPHENYVDRNGDTFMGVWSGKVDEQAYKYYRPQETGNKTDVRWAMLLNDAGTGVSVRGAQPLSMSATNNYPEDLDPGTTKKQQHSSDILPRNETVVTVDLFQRGVAGLDSWRSKPLEEYRYFKDEYQYEFTIAPVEGVKIKGIR